MSTQWASDPYFYPIQIAQYALQHYSRNTTGLWYCNDKVMFLEPIARSVTLGELNDAWNSAPDYGKSSKISQRFDNEIKEKVLDIISEGTQPFFTFSRNSPEIFCSMFSAIVYHNLHYIVVICLFSLLLQLNSKILASFYRSITILNCMCYNSAGMVRLIQVLR